MSIIYSGDGDFVGNFGGSSGTGSSDVTSVNNKTGDVTLTKSDIGLSSVDNTTDSEKNVLSASKWTVARNLSFTGGATGTGTLDGSQNVSISLTVDLSTC